MLDGSMVIDAYLLDQNGDRASISYGLLKTAYSDTCISCANNNAFQSTSQILALCGYLYKDGAKCEAMHGFSSGNGGDNNADDVLIAREAAVCNLISDLTSLLKNGSIGEFNGTDVASDELSIASNLSSHAVKQIREMS